MPSDFEAFYLRHCRAIYRVCFAFLKNASPVQGELLAVRLTEGLSVILLKINFHAFQEGLSKKLTPPASAGAVPSRSR